VKEYYFLVVSGGTEIEKEGPFETFKERDARAKVVWRHLSPDKGDNIFWLDIAVGDVVNEYEPDVGAYIGGDLDP